MQHQHCNPLLPKSQNKVYSLLKHTIPWPSSQTPTDQRIHSTSSGPIIPVTSNLKPSDPDVSTSWPQTRRWQLLTTRLLPLSTSTLLPRTTKGKFSGSDGLACPKKTVQKYIQYPPTIKQIPHNKSKFLQKSLPEWETPHANCQGCQMISSH